MENINVAKNMLTYYWFYVPASLLKLVSYSTNNCLINVKYYFVVHIWIVLHRVINQRTFATMGKTVPCSHRVAIDP